LVPQGAQDTTVSYHLSLWVHAQGGRGNKKIGLETPGRPGLKGEEAEGPVVAGTSSGHHPTSLFWHPYSAPLLSLQIFAVEMFPSMHLSICVRNS